MTVVCLDGSKVSVPTLLAQIAEYPGLDAVVAVVRVDGCWRTAWSSGVDLGGLSMASMKLTYDIQQELHREADDPRPGRSSSEKEPA